MDFVGVARDDGVETCRVWIHIEFVQVVQDIERGSSQFHDFLCWKLICPPPVVDVSADHEKRPDSLQLVKDFRFADVSRVNNQVSAGKGGLRFWPKQSVSIGNNADNTRTFCHGNNHNIMAHESCQLKINIGSKNSR